MATLRTYTRSFNGGEVSPEFFGRIDDIKFQMGLALCRNFFVLPHGPVANRGGTEFVRRVKTPAKRTRLLSFTFSTDQTMVIEFGEGYFRFHTQGATVLDGVAPYELAHPYTEAQLFEVIYVQSADVITLTHKDHPPRELRRYGATNWQLIDINFATSAPAPSAIVVTPNVPSGTANLRPYDYLVTGVKDGQESFLPPYATGTNNLDAAGTYNDISWTAATSSVDYYNVYRRASGVFAFIGQTTELTLRDEGITPDVSITPVRAANPFAGAGNYPRAVTYFEQRRVFAGTTNAPQTLWMTRSGTESNMDVSLPSREDDAITFRIAAREANTIRHLVPLQDLMVMTQSAEWRVNSDISPTSLSVKPQSFVGAGQAVPLVVNNNMLFVADRGGHVRELGFSNDAGGYVTGDLSLRSAHLFDGLDIVDTAQSKAPYPICWFVSTSGLLLGLTYIPEQQVYAWHRHDTDGVFESVAVVAEGDDDIAYVVVRREVNGETTRYVERMAPRSAGFFVDAGVRYSGAPEISFSDGLSHLEGKTVSVLADGAVLAPRIIAGGTLTLDQAASEVIVGLPILADLTTLPFAAEVQAFGQGRPKSVNQVWMRFFGTRGGLAGSSFGRLYEVKQRTDEPPGTPPEATTGEAQLTIGDIWGRDGQLCIRQKDPLPMMLLSLTMEVAVAG